MVRLLALLLALRAGASMAGEVWVPTAPVDAQIGSWRVAADPWAAQTLYADVGRQAVARSVDGGHAWTPRLSTGNIKRIVVERAAPGRISVLVDTFPGFLHRSVDGGETWNTRSLSSPVRGIPEDIALDPVDSNVLYLALAVNVLNPSSSPGGLIKSVNGGQSWTPVLTGTSVQQVVIDMFDPSVIYAVSPQSISNPNGVARRSMNGGATWTAVAEPGHATIDRIVLDTIVPGVIYASAAVGFWRSDDRGATWQGLSSRWPTMHTFALDPTRPGVIVGYHSSGIGIQPGISRSADGGSTWSTLSQGFSSFVDPTAVAHEIVFAASGALYAATSRGLLKLIATAPKRRAARH